jgi:hypothetical protein
VVGSILSGGHFPATPGPPHLRESCGVRTSWGGSRGVRGAARPSSQCRTSIDAHPSRLCHVG